MSSYFNRNIKQPIKEEAFDKGGLLHDMLECHYIQLQDHYKKQTNLPKEVYDIFVQRSLELGRNSAASRDLDTEDCLRVIEAYRQYAEYRFGESWIPLFVEQVGTKELWKGNLESEEVQILYAAKIDLIAKTDWQ